METKKTLDTLSSLIEDTERLSAEEREAISEARNTMLSYERKKQVETDFQGWEMPHYTLKQLREFVKSIKSADGDCKILVLEDDGMGYGANNGYCTELSMVKNKEGKDEIRIWF